MSKLINAEIDTTNSSVRAYLTEITSLRTERDALRTALSAMVDRWEPDCDGQDRIMWENAMEALGREIWDRATIKLTEGG